MARPCRAYIQQAIEVTGGWLPFDRFMALALYAPDIGYYASNAPKFGLSPQSGSDFVTAPELSPLFGQVLATQLAQAVAHWQVRCWLRLMHRAHR